MRASEFEQKNAEKWRDYDEVLQRLEKRKKRADQDVEHLPKMLRERCIELSLARHRMYGATLCEFLNQQVIRGHKIVAHTSGNFIEKTLKMYFSTFPRVVRAEWKLFVLCWLFFLIPFVGMWVSVYYDLDWVRSILGSEGMANMDAMYGKGEDTVSEFREREGSDFMMFAYYIYNNIGIDFQIIAGGLLAGVGSLLILLLNGLGIGGAMAYVMEYGDPEKLFTFVAGHSSYEFTGMVIAGMAGMRMGLGILNPGRMSLGRALLESGKRGLPLVCGAFMLTLIAAFVEGFWSAEDFAPHIKYVVGIAGWLLLVVYFLFAGRGTQHEN